MKKEKVTFEAILRQPGASAAWTKLEEIIPVADLECIKRYLEALANQAPSFRWIPPSPRDARRLAEKLNKVATQVRRMNLYFGSELPLGNPNYVQLPWIIGKYADELKQAAASRRKLRPPKSEDEQRELEILRLLEISTSDQREHHSYEQAATLIQAAYNTGFVDRNVNAGQLRGLYDRQSYNYRASRD